MASEEISVDRGRVLGVNLTPNVVSTDNARYINFHTCTLNMSSKINKSKIVHDRLNSHYINFIGTLFVNPWRTP